MVKGIPKIYGFVAEKSNLCVFLYRKSNKITYMILFDYNNKKDKLILGSKFYGRLYPSRCDISPNGSDFLYYAFGKSQKQYAKKMYTWTGICTPPNINACWILGHGDTWGGGGRFLDEKNIIINPGMYPDPDIGKKEFYKQYKITFNCDIEYEYCDKWRIVQRNKYGEAISWKKTCGNISITKLLKKNDSKSGAYSRFDFNISCNKDTNVLYGAEEEINWADFDTYGRLLLGCGNRIKIYNKTLAVPKILTIDV